MSDVKRKPWMQQECEYQALFLKGAFPDQAATLERAAALIGLLAEAEEALRAYAHGKRDHRHAIAPMPSPENCQSCRAIDVHDRIVEALKAEEPHRSGLSMQASPRPVGPERW